MRWDGQPCWDAGSCDEYANWYRSHPANSKHASRRKRRLANRAGAAPSYLAHAALAAVDLAGCVLLLLLLLLLLMLELQLLLCLHMKLLMHRHSLHWLLLGAVGGEVRGQQALHGGLRRHHAALERVPVGEGRVRSRRRRCRPAVRPSQRIGPRACSRASHADRRSRSGRSIAASAEQRRILVP